MSTQQRVFEAAVEDLSGATCLVAGEVFDIAAALKKGDGQIVLDLNQDRDRQIADALRLHPAVKDGKAAKTTSTKEKGK